MATRRTFVATYIMASGRNGTLYTGMSANLEARVWKHRAGTFEGFSKRYGCTQLVWFERFGLVVDAIRREKRIKEWKRLEAEADRGKQSRLGRSGDGLVPGQ